MKIAETARAGLWLGLAGIIVLSPDALLVRLFNGDSFALIAGRALVLALLAGVLVAVIPSLRHGFRWLPIWGYGATYAVGLATFPLSILHTHVANTVVILAVAPLLSAIGARWLLKESVARQTWLASTVAVGGLALVFAPQLAAGKVIGDMLALVTAISLAGGAIIIRKYPHISLFPGFIIGGLMCALLYAPFADWQLSLRDGGLLVVNGSILLAAFFCIMAAARRLPPPEVNLLFLLEAVLAPLWVWLVLSEKPPLATVIAGTLIIAVLVWHSIGALRQPRRSTDGVAD